MKEWILQHTEIDEQSYNELINETTVNNENKKYTKDELNLSSPLANIKYFTLEKPTLLSRIMFGIKKTKNYYTHKGIKFKILAEEIPDLAPISHILYSSERQGKCFALSIMICFLLKNCYLTTAMCIDPFIKETTHFLHSFIVIKTDKEELVLDPTSNIIIPKETFFQIYQAKTISEISQERFLNDKEILESVKEANLTGAEYVCFPDEIIRGIKKYKKTI